MILKNTLDLNYEDKIFQFLKNLIDKQVSNHKDLFLIL